MVSGAVVRPDTSGIGELVLARLHAADLNLLLRDRRTLIRRLSFDLTGLPPKHEDVERFLTDESPDAYEQLVDRLGFISFRRALGSPLARYC